MGWKNWSYKKRYGVIGLIIGIILGIIDFITQYFLISGIHLRFSPLYYILFFVFGYFVDFFIHGDASLAAAIILGSLMLIVHYFLIGLLIGWIRELIIKKRKGEPLGINRSQAWVRGGLIGLIICIVFILIAFLPFTWKILAPFDIFFYGVILFPIGTKILYQQFLSSLFRELLYTLLIYFLIGALIGWIIGKIKARKQQVPIQNKKTI